MTVVVEVAGAGGLAPAAVRQTGARGHVLERAVPAITIEMVGRLLPFRKALQHRPVDEEDVDPAVAVIIERGRARAGRLDQVRIRALCAVRRPRVKPGTVRDVGESEAEFPIPP